MIVSFGWHLFSRIKKRTDETKILEIENMIDLMCFSRAREKLKELTNWQKKVVELQDRISEREKFQSKSLFFKF